MSCTGGGIQCLMLIMEEKCCQLGVLPSLHGYCGLTVQWHGNKLQPDHENDLVMPAGFRFGLRNTAWLWRMLPGLWPAQQRLRNEGQLLSALPELDLAAS